MQKILQKEEAKAKKINKDKLTNQEPLKDNRLVNLEIELDSDMEAEADSEVDSESESENDSEDSD